VQAKLKKEVNEFLRNFNITAHPKVVRNELLDLENFLKEINRYTKENFRTSTQNIYKNAMSNFISIIENKPILLITSNDIERFKSERIKQVNKTTANIDLRTIKASFNLAVQWKLIKENPCKEIKQFKIEEKEILSFTDEEIKLLISSINNSRIKRIIKFALHTGCRISEIVNLEWRDLDYKERVLIIRNKEGFYTKSGKNRKIPLTNNILEIITELKEIKDKIVRIENDYLFIKENGNNYNRTNLSMEFKSYIRKIGLSEKYNFHCLRHTFVTRLIKAGININYVKELAGHSSINTTMNYIHIVSEDLREAINKIHSY